MIHCELATLQFAVCLHEKAPGAAERLDQLR